MIKFTELEKREFALARKFHKDTLLELLTKQDEDYEQQVLRFIDLAFCGDIKEDKESRTKIYDFFINEAIEDLHGLMQLAAITVFDMLTEISQE